ncbi:LCP family protein [Sporichthya sp.]|uniref:LCP family protein n=1 Tax=Sporichthya sp. TaxID=65475 RepID=UPI0017CC0647|nr:LCP family protein [Sporichthya sp.]MBA3742825.1 LCP family protein [Sporichthya sp.]
MQSSKLADVGRRSELVRFRRALVLLCMTLVLPGSAQLMCGNKAVGRAALRVLGILAVGTVIVVWREGKEGLLELGFESWALIALQTGIVVLGLCWLALFMDAWRLGRPPTLVKSHRLTVSILSLVLMGLIATPAAYSANLIQTHRNFLETTFDTGGVKDLYNGRLNILLLGGDGGDGRTGIRTDSITLASIDVSNGKTVLFSLPRNLQYAPFPPETPMAAQFPNGYPDFAFGIYTYGSEHPEFFKGAKDPGALAMMQMVAQTMGIPVHYYGLVNLEGFESVVNALGGVTIRVEQRLPIGGGTSMSGVAMPIRGYIEPGLQKLSGYKALWYARSRSSTDDYDRITRQKCVMGAILRAADPAKILFNYTKLTKASKQVLTTDLSIDAVKRLIGVVSEAKNQKMTSVQFIPPAIDPAAPDIEYIRAQVQKALLDSEKPTPTPTPSETPKKKKKKPTASATPSLSADNVVPGESVSIDDTCKYS